MLKTMEKILMSMGYRKVEDTRYIKPVGYQLLCFCTESKKLATIFQNADDESISIWKYSIFNDNMDFLEWLCNEESMTRLDIRAGRRKFNFLSIHEEINF